MTGSTTRSCMHLSGPSEGCYVGRVAASAVSGRGGCLRVGLNSRRVAVGVAVVIGRVAGRAGTTGNYVDVIFACG